MGDMNYDYTIVGYNESLPHETFADLYCFLYSKKRYQIQTLMGKPRQIDLPEDKASEEFKQITLRNQQILEAHAESVKRIEGDQVLEAVMRKIPNFEPSNINIIVVMSSALTDDLLKSLKHRNIILVIDKEIKPPQPPPPPPAGKPLPGQQAPEPSPLMQLMNDEEYNIVNIVNTIGGETGEVYSSITIDATGAVVSDIINTHKSYIVPCDLIGPLQEKPVTVGGGSKRSNSRNAKSSKKLRANSNRKRQTLKKMRGGGFIQEQINQLNLLSINPVYTPPPVEGVATLDNEKQAFQTWLRNLTVGNTISNYEDYMQYRGYQMKRMYASSIYNTCNDVEINEAFAGLDGIKLSKDLVYCNVVNKEDFKTRFKDTAFEGGYDANPTDYTNTGKPKVILSHLEGTDKTGIVLKIEEIAYKADEADEVIGDEVEGVIGEGGIVEGGIGEEGIGEAEGNKKGDKLSGIAKLSKEVNEYMNNLTKAANETQLGSDISTDSLNPSITIAKSYELTEIVKTTVDDCKMRDIKSRSALPYLFMGLPIARELTGDAGVDLTGIITSGKEAALNSAQQALTNQINGLEINKKTLTEAKAQVSNPDSEAITAAQEVAKAALAYAENAVVAAKAKAEAKAGDEAATATANEAVTNAEAAVAKAQVAAKPEKVKEKVIADAEAQEARIGNQIKYLTEKQTELEGKFRELPETGKLYCTNTIKDKQEANLASAQRRIENLIIREQRNFYEITKEAALLAGKNKEEIKTLNEALDGIQKDKITVTLNKEAFEAKVKAVGVDDTFIENVINYRGVIDSIRAEESEERMGLMEEARAAHEERVAAAEAAAAAADAATAAAAGTDDAAAAADADVATAAAAGTDAAAEAAAAGTEPSPFIPPPLPQPTYCPSIGEIVEKVNASVDVVGILRAKAIALKNAISDKNKNNKKILQKLKLYSDSAYVAAARATAKPIDAGVFKEDVQVEGAKESVAREARPARVVNIADAMAQDSNIQPNALPANVGITQGYQTGVLATGPGIGGARKRRINSKKKRSAGRKRARTARKHGGYRKIISKNRVIFSRNLKRRKRKSGRNSRGRK